MKTIKKTILLMAGIAIMTTVSCTKDASLETADEVNLSTPIEQLGEKPGMEEERKAQQKFLQSRVPIVYEAELDGTTVTSTFTIGGFVNPKYYYFSAEAGDEITIYVRRLVADIDPVASLSLGIGDTDVLSFITSSDDAIADDFGGCFSDPFISYTVATTGDYTLRVWDFGGPLMCGSTDPADIEIITTGINDSDNDGCLNDVDPYPNSIIGGTVSVGDCDSGVPNVFVDDCTTMMDLVTACIDAGGSDADVTACIIALSNGWRVAGFIDGRQNFAIKNCARAYSSEEL